MSCKGRLAIGTIQCVLTSGSAYRPFINAAPSLGKLTFIYNSMLNLIPVSFCTAYIFVTFRVRVRVGVKVMV